MKLRLACGIALGLAAFTAAPEVLADDSTKGPLFVQATLLGLGYHNAVGSRGDNWAGYRPDFEIGYHPSGRYDGIVLGLRQAFNLTLAPGRAGGATQIFGGYDIPLKVAGFEVIAAPYAMLGVGYVFDGPSAGINLVGGVEGKVFLLDSLYAHVRPFEMGVQCFHDVGECAIAMSFGLGGGYAFGK